MEKTINIKVVAPTLQEIKATEEYKAFINKVKSMTKTISDEPVLTTS